MDIQKQNNTPISVRRLIALVLLFVVVFLGFAVRLYRVQITEHAFYREQARGGATLTLPVAASRGEVLDRDLSPLVANSTAYAVVLDYNYFPAGTDEAARTCQNRVIRALTDLLTLDLSAVPNDEMEQALLDSPYYLSQYHMRLALSADQSRWVSAVEAAFSDYQILSTPATVPNG